MWFTNSGARRMHGDPAHRALEKTARPSRSRSSTLICAYPADTPNWIPPERLLGVLNGVGAVLHVFQDVISGRGPVQDFSGLLAGETLIDRQAHPAAAASGVHLHE
jgi:hypothetical protein